MSKLDAVSFDSAPVPAVPDAPDGATVDLAF